MTQTFLKPGFWITTISVSLIILHLQVQWEVTQSLDQVCLSLIFWLAILSLIWSKRHQIKLKSGPISMLVGLVLLTNVLVRIYFSHSLSNVLVDISPILSGFGIALVTVGFSQLKYFKRELLILIIGFLPINHVTTFLGSITNYSLLAAQFSHTLLWYIGFTVTRQGVYVMLPQGAIEVNTACSGLPSMLQHLQLALLFLLVFPTRPVAKILIPVAGVLIAFIVNGVRIALLATVVAYSTESSFAYWHDGSGAQLFSLVSMITFGFLCQRFMSSDGSDSSDKSLKEAL